MIILGSLLSLLSGLQTNQSLRDAAEPSTLFKQSQMPYIMQLALDSGHQSPTHLLLDPKSASSRRPVLLTYDPSSPYHPPSILYRFKSKRCPCNGPRVPKGSRAKADLILHTSLAGEAMSSPYHAHDLEALDSRGGCLHRLEAASGSDDLLERAMVCFNDVVQTL